MWSSKYNYTHKVTVVNVQVHAYVMGSRKTAHLEQSINLNLGDQTIQALETISDKNALAIEGLRNWILSKPNLQFGETYPKVNAYTEISSLCSTCI